MNPHEEFQQEVAANITGLADDTHLAELSAEWIRETTPHRYTYNFTWLGRPIIQFPQDVVALQEIVWATKPELIIETGIAHGGSLILSASMLELLGGQGRVVGVDIDIRAHNRAAIDEHPLSKRITMIEGSSIDPTVVEQVAEIAAGSARTMVILDSSHTHDHVLEELRLYSPFVHAGCYLVVFDTVIDHLPAEAFPDRPWGPGDNPKTAVHEFLSTSSRFEIDRSLHSKLLITVAPDGYLRCIEA